MRTFVLLALAACTGDPYVLDTGDPVDTGVPECGRIRGTEHVLMYQEGGNTVRTPLETPNSYESTTGVAGPVGDDRTYLAVITGQAIVSVDGGCNWADAGALPSGNWKLRTAGARVYAFDTLSAAGARTDDLGVTWTPFDATEAFIGLPLVDASNPDRLRGLQPRGIVTSTDAGDTWTVDAALPTELASPTDGDLLASNLDMAVVGGANGAWRTMSAGSTWVPIATDAVQAIAIHPDDENALFVQTADTAGLKTISRSSNAGAEWSRQVDSSQIELLDAPELWPVPGNPLQVLSAFGPIYNANTESTGVNLYIVTGGEGTRTVYVGTWFAIHQIVFAEDRWMAAVDAVQ